MRKVIVLLVGAITLSGCATGYKTVKKPGFMFREGTNAAIMRFEGNNASVGNSIADAFIPELMDMGFNVVERGQLKKILKERQGSLSGAFDTETIKKMGETAGVDIMVFGRYSSHKETTRSVTKIHHPAHRKPGKHKKGVAKRRVDISSEIVFSSLSIRFVDVKTGSIVTSCTMKREFPADKLGNILSDMADSIKKTWGIN